VTDGSISADGALASSSALSPRRLILPLALAQFICSFAGSNMNVMINDISHDLDTTVKGVQTAITLFLLASGASTAGSRSTGSGRCSARRPPVSAC
jgi:hypothetical protein